MQVSAAVWPGRMAIAAMPSYVAIWLPTVCSPASVASVRAFRSVKDAAGARAPRPLHVARYYTLKQTLAKPKTANLRKKVLPFAVYPVPPADSQQKGYGRPAEAAVTRLKLYAPIRLSVCSRARAGIGRARAAGRSARDGDDRFVRQKGCPPAYRAFAASRASITRATPRSLLEGAMKRACARMCSPALATT